MYYISLTVDFNTHTVEQVNNKIKQYNLLS